MSIVKAGIMCDVCGSFMVTEMLLNQPIESFGVKGIETTLHCDDKCKELLIACGKDWTKLPSGPLRRSFEEANKKLEAQTGREE